MVFEVGEVAGRQRGAHGVDVDADQEAVFCAEVLGHFDPVAFVGFLQSVDVESVVGASGGEAADEGEGVVVGAFADLFEWDALGQWICRWVKSKSEAPGFGAKEILELGFVRQFEAVRRNEEPFVHASEGIFGEGVVFVGTEEQAYGRAVVLAHLMLAVVAEVGVELSGVRMGERLRFEVDEHVAFDPAVVENQIDKVVRGTDTNFLLAGLKAKSVAKFKEKGRCARKAGSRSGV